MRHGERTCASQFILLADNRTLKEPDGTIMGVGTRVIAKKPSVERGAKWMPVGPWWFAHNMRSDGGRDFQHPTNPRRRLH